MAASQYYEMRRWVACRLYTATHTSTRARWTSIWAEGRAESLQLGRQRFQAIERYLSVYSSSTIAEGPHIWFIKVKTAVHAVRSAFQYHLIPSSHLTVDESPIQFFGRQKNKYRMRHKPAGEGFIMFALCSYERLVHDFAVHSAELRDTQPQKFGFFANLPDILDTEAALEEIRYALDELRANGVAQSAFRQRQKSRRKMVRVDEIRWERSAV